MPAGPDLGSSADAGARAELSGLRDVYVVLGYGSLIWDLEVLAPQVRLPWYMDAGPRLPMEFSRISPKRLMGLVVVIDADHGQPCPTHAIASRRDDIHAVAEDLRERERANNLDYIGAVCLRTGFERALQPHVATQIRDWCAAAGAAGAVWADLPRNFQQRTGGEFSIGSALAYLHTLSGANLEEAVRYIENAPSATDTRLRRVLAVDAWWQAVAEALPPTPGNTV